MTISTFANDTDASGAPSYWLIQPAEGESALQGLTVRFDHHFGYNLTQVSIALSSHFL